MDKKVIGITGAVGSGKSSLLSVLEEKFPVRLIRADELGHEIYKKNSKGYKSIVSHFGDEIVDSDGEIDRKLLGNRAFNNPEELEWLNTIIHPYVRQRIEEEAESFRAQDEKKILFIESAIILENGYEDICDEFWYVYVTEANRRERLRRGRGYSQEKTEDILKNQMSDEFFRSKCRVILDNNGEIEDTIQQVIHVLDREIKFML